MSNLNDQLARTLLPAARLWIRYMPGSILKRPLWDVFSWRNHRFQARTRFGYRIRGQTQDLIQRYLYYFGVWEPVLSQWLRQQLRPGDVFIDVGANIGYYSLLAAKLVGPEGRVIAIEAAPAIYEQLQSNIELNRLTNVRSICSAAAAERGQVGLYAGEDGNIGATTTIPGVFRTQALAEVSARPLPELLHDDELTRARVIKIDVEGAEWSVLKGLETALARLPDTVELAVEIAPRKLHLQQQSAADIFRMLGAAGFHAYALDNSYDPFTYLIGKGASRLPRLVEPPATKTFDAVFSRVDAEWL